MKHSWNEEQQGRGIMADRFDLDAIDADDALLDLLAAGGEPARSAGTHDPAVALLAELRLAVEVEDELPVETIDDPESFLARCAALNPITDPFARKVATRGLALSVAAVAALSVSGVAAAVNGDPLSPYEKVIEKMVDAVRPQTSFPKEQLDGLPVVDKTKIVKVAKDFQKKQEQKAAAEEKVVQVDTPPPPAAVIQRALPEVLQQVLPKAPTATQLPADPPAVVTTTEPPKTDDPTTQPTEAPTSQPTDPATTTTPPPAETTEPPATPTDPPPTTPSDPPSTPNNTETGTGNPTTAPTGDTNTGDTSTGGSTTEPGSDTSTTTQPSSTVPAAPTDQQPTGDTSQPPSDPPQDPLTGLVDAILAPLLPTPSGGPVEVQSAQQFFGKGVATIGKHSNGKVTTGSVREAYPQGKHSTGSYAEGKHAAIARAHGSTADADVLQILGVVNTPTN